MAGGVVVIEGAEGDAGVAHAGGALFGEAEEEVLVEEPKDKKAGGAGDECGADAGEMVCGGHGDEGGGDAGEGDDGEIDDACEGAIAYGGDEELDGAGLGLGLGLDVACGERLA